MSRRLSGWRALGTDLGAATLDATAALVVTGLVFGWFTERVEVGASQTLGVMSMVSDVSGHWLYLLCQAFGWSALLWVWITIMLGLVRASTWANVVVPAPRLERWHRTTSLTTLALFLGHAAAYSAYSTFQRPGASVGEGLRYAFVPGGFQSHTNGNVGVLVGILAFYLAIPLSLAYYARHRVGGRVWRVLHRFIVVVYVLSVWHTLLTGTDLVMTAGGFRTAIWVLQLPVAGLLLARLLAPLRHDQRLNPTDAVRSSPVVLAVRVAGRVGAAAMILVLLGLIGTGRLGGAAPGRAATVTTVTPEMVWSALAALVLLIAVAVLATRRTPVNAGTAQGRLRHDDRDAGSAGSFTDEQPARTRRDPGTARRPGAT